MTLKSYKMEETRRYHYHYTTEATFVPAVAYHFFKLRAEPANNSCQKVEEQEVAISPQGGIIHHSTDAFGNKTIYGSYNATHDFFRVESEGTVVCKKYEIAEEEASDIYRHPSSLTQTDTALRDWARNSVDPRGEIACQLMNATHEFMTYQANVTTNKTTALEAFGLRKGVCQDFAHLMIAACRCMGLKARYVNGLVLGEGATHAWVEVYDGAKWQGYDPTHNLKIEWGYVKLGHGRDVNDCSSNRGIIYTPTNERLTVKCEMNEI